MNFNPFEERFLSGNRLDTRTSALERQRERERRVIEAAHQKATDLLRKDAISPMVFADVYGEEAIMRDMRTIGELEKKFREQERKESADERRTPEQIKETRQLAEIFEAIMHEQVELANWLGQHSISIKASRYDDILNKVDEIVEFNNPPADSAHLALTIDVTFSSELARKFASIRQEIETGELATIKYFQSELSKERGPKSMLPRVVIGISRKEILNLIELWMNKRTKELGNHPVQVLILRQMLLELKAFRQYADTRGNQEKKKNIVREYDRAIAIISSILAEKEKQFGRDADILASQDTVFAEIARRAANFGTLPAKSL